VIRPATIPCGAVAAVALAATLPHALSVNAASAIAVAHR
jgi:hypothetical protein